MSFSVLVIALCPLFLIPLWTHHLFQRVYSLEKSFIALDNGAIILGRRDRENFNLIEKANMFMANLEKLHHPVHAAVASGVATPAVIAQDKLLEALILATHKKSLVSAQLLWTKSFLESTRAIQKMDETIESKVRRMKVPVVSKTCPVCFLSNRVDVISSEVTTHLQVENKIRKVDVLVEPFIKFNLGRKEWEYKFKEAF